MARVHYLQDRVKLRRRIKRFERGVVENVNRGIVEENPQEYPDERDDASGWIPARIRGVDPSPETADLEVKVDLPILYELVMYAYDEHGKPVCPKQHDQVIIRYSRDNKLVETTAEARIVGTIEEVRKRSKLFSYVMPIVLDTEF